MNFSIMMVLAFLAVFLIAGTVYAEDGAPPEEPAPPAQEAVPEAGAATETDVEAEVPAVEVGVDPALAETSTESAVETPPVEINADVDVEAAAKVIEPGEAILPVGESSAVLEDSAEILAENEIVLVNEGGEAIDLASEESLEIVSGGDPWWIVAGVKYAYVKFAAACPADTVLGTTCFVHATTPISAALAYMDANNLVPTDGILHVEPDTYNETTITINGTAGNGYLANLKGLVSEGTSANTTLVANVTVSNTLLGFTLSGFTITGALDFHNNLGILTLNDLAVTNTSGVGIQVSNHNGAVNVTKVEASHNKYYGMTVDNTAGTLGVTITNSEFSHNNDSNASNYWGGLRVESKGIITLNGVAACNNDGNGAFLDAAKGTVVKNSAFNGNLAVPLMGGVGYGLYVNNTYTTNNISLENVQADSNTNYGIYFMSSANVTLKNVNACLNGVGSGYQGALIDNRSGIGTVSITNGTFNQNGDDGLRILSHKNVTLNGISTLENDGVGTYIDNCDLSGSTCLGTGSVSITGNLPNYFNDNDEFGLQILSGGNVLLSNFQASANKYSGILISNNYTGRSGTVTLNVTYVPTVGSWTNSASSNLQGGVQVDSFGNISMDKCLFTDNGSYGARLSNSSALGAKTITVKNSSAFANGSYGFSIESTGNVTINNTNAYENPSSSGLVINNTYGTGSVTISGVGTVKNDYSGNNAYGILKSSPRARWRFPTWTPPAMPMELASTMILGLAKR